MTILVLNVGSSSVKFAAFARDSDGMREIARGLTARPGSLGHAGEVAAGDLELLSGIIAALEREHGALVAVGHRIVHGGRVFLTPVVVDEANLAAIEAMTPLAPLHQPHNAMAIRAVSRLRPLLRQVACFDTAFHRTQPELHRRLPLPDSYFAEGVERYGFHGLSYAWLVREIGRLRGEVPRRILAYHLGAGASACAILDGRSHDTSMGFSTLDGLMMATRPGSLDPGVLLHLLANGASGEDLTNLLYTRSGLLGVSGTTGDMKALLASSDPSARLAVDMFSRRAAAVGAALVTSLGGLDAVVFTGGIGEHAGEIRTKICDLLGFLGVEIDPQYNRQADARISPDDAAVECWIVRADEERMIAEAVVEHAC
jgi:acetate kinase